MVAVTALTRFIVLPPLKYLDAIAQFVESWLAHFEVKVVLPLPELRLD